MSSDQTNRCQESKLNGASCGWPVFDLDENKCIFHSLKIDEKKQIFQKVLENYIKSIHDRTDQDLDFSRFNFPDFSLEGFTLKRPAFFNAAKFYGRANFKETTFEANADFTGTEFRSEAVFF